MTRFRVLLTGLAVGGIVMVGCGWRGPATILLLDGNSVRCPNVYITKEYVSCVGIEGGERLYHLDRVKSVIEPTEVALRVSPQG